MPSPFAGFLPPLLAVLALLSPGKAVAGPPEGASGRMVLDEVAAGLRKYKKERDVAKRICWLRKVAPNHDPRVGLAIGEAISDVDPGLSACAVELLWVNFVPGGIGGASDPLKWWRDYEADLRRRAAQLPR